MDKNPVANLDSVKQFNLARLFKIIVEYGLISRTQLVDVSNMAAGSVTKLSRLLIEQGLVHEVAHMASERGRKAVLLAPKSDDIQILAARADRQYLYVGLCDLSGNLLHRISVPLNARSEADFVAQITQTLTQFLTDHEGQIRHIIGVGVTMPGLVDAENGVVNFMPHVPVNQLPLRQLLQDALGLPCYLNSFSSAMALAEKQIGASFHAKNSLFVEIHNGVGSGLIINDELHSGAGVGEIGHIQVDPLGKHCVCGNFGCLETVVSDGAITLNYAFRAGETGNTTLSIKDVVSRAIDMEPTAIAVLKEAAAHLGSAIAMVVNVLRPDSIILAGEITQAWAIIEPVIQQQLKTKSLQIQGLNNVAVVRSDLYDSPWYSGYALVRQALLSGELLPNLLVPDQTETN
ncbi:MAG: ROK family protein [Reinekea sp.]|nr:ROK family protein [Reinekea sp.]